MAFQLYNTLTQTLQEVVSLQDRDLRMYTCGPTVYDYVHIGNFRTFTFQDLLRRYLLYKGFKVTHVMNITDVDDKIIAGAKASGESIAEYTQRFAQAFSEDMKQLRLQQPEVMPKATDHIQQMVKLILRLREKGLTYERDGSTYYRISGLSTYGRLSQLNLNELEQGDATDADEYSKENPRDFVLWKVRKPGEAYWETPLGPGRPGWHIECSAMSMEYLGESFDLHSGGIDLIFPHHENEIAQSEGATGKSFVRYWVHSAHLMVEGEKMSKSKGNFYTLRDLLDQGCDPVAVRYLLLGVHYRKRLNFTFEGLNQAQAALHRANDFIQRIREVPDGGKENKDLQIAIVTALRDFEFCLDDDLNTSAALASVFELVRLTNISLEKNQVGGSNRDAILDFFSRVNQIFHTFQLETLQLDDVKVERLIRERIEVRQQRDYARADEIRNLLFQKGIILEDTRERTRWKRIDRS